MREALLALLVLPYAYYGGKDNLFHFRGRTVSMTEHLLHLAVGVGAFSMIGGLFMAQRPPVVRGAAVLLAAGALDEFVFHKGLPETESDLHAKAHWSLLLLLAVGLLWA